VLLLIKLKFNSTLRIGQDVAQGDEFQGIVHSDTIYSALMNEWVRAFPDESVDDLITNVPFKISSAFPYFLQDYYLPTPLGTSRLYTEKLIDVPFLELYDFLDLAQGNHERIMEKNIANAIEDVIFNLTVPRVSIDRISASTNIFESSGWQFKTGGGLYFLIELTDASVEDRLRLCITLLGQSGLGGDRSVGYGLFESEMKRVEQGSGWEELFTEREGENISYCTLSLCCPTKDDAKESISYRLVTRKGWIFSRSSSKQMKRRDCKMFAEGSLFTKPITGRIADVTPVAFRAEHNIYRYGLGIFVKIQV
jgi:CRISPR-associated protein Csm4